MKCLVIEDEKVAAERLIKLIQTYDSSIEISGVMQSVNKSVAWFEENQESPDLIFMDIQLADGLSFEIFEQTEINSPVIFTTAFNEYALKAFKVNSVDYLLKPIDIDELGFAIEKFKKNQQNYSYPVHAIDTILKNLTNNYKSKFVIKVGEHIKVVPVKEVSCFNSLEKSTFLQNTEGREYAVNYSLYQLEELLDPNLFFRISRKFIVHIEAIEDIISYSNSRLRLVIKGNSSDEIIVSRERVQKFKDWLEG
jgi:two-component system response regulator LytT